jgi:hypothetical protein
MKKSLNRNCNYLYQLTMVKKFNILNCLIINNKNTYYKNI